MGQNDREQKSLKEYSSKEYSPKHSRVRGTRTKKKHVQRIFWKNSLKNQNILEIISLKN